MTRRVVRKKDSTVATGQGVATLVEQYQQVDKMLKMWTEQKKVLRDRLLQEVEDRGYQDEKLHTWFELPEDVGGVHSICKQMRVSQVFQEGIAEDELKRLDLWEECTTQITVIDEDVVLAKAFEGEIPEDVMQKLYEEKINYALVFK